jgi:hypothetical protein
MSILLSSRSSLIASMPPTVALELHLAEDLDKKMWLFIRVLLQKTGTFILNWAQWSGLYLSRRRGMHIITILVRDKLTINFPLFKKLRDINTF